AAPARGVVARVDVRDRAALAGRERSGLRVVRRALLAVPGVAGPRVVAAARARDAGGRAPLVVHVAARPARVARSPDRRAAVAPVRGAVPAAVPSAVPAAPRAAPSPADRDLAVAPAQRAAVSEAVAPARPGRVSDRDAEAVRDGRAVPDRADPRRVVVARAVDDDAVVDDRALVAGRVADVDHG